MLSEAELREIVFNYISSQYETLICQTKGTLQETIVAVPNQYRYLE